MTMTMMTCKTLQTPRFQARSQDQLDQACGSTILGSWIEWGVGGHPHDNAPHPPRSPPLIIEVDIRKLGIRKSI
jgi:hypothetical protein